jgi:hypothetical protein
LIKISVPTSCGELKEVVMDMKLIKIAVTVRLWTESSKYGENGINSKMTEIVNSV